MGASVADALARSHDPSWEVRQAGAGELGAGLPDPAAFARLVELLDDPGDTAVGRQAAVELTRHGGRAGLAEVARAWATLDDDLGYALAAALGQLWHRDGFALRSGLDALATHDDPDVVRGAAELSAYLRVE